jgi:hypothetical protein
MGADGCGKRFEKRRECLHEAIDFIRVFANFEFANRPQKRLKYGYFELDVLPVFLPLKNAKLKLGISSLGPDCVADCIGKASRWKQLLNAII